MASCNHVLDVCSECRTSLKQEVKQEVLKELLPLIANIFVGSTEDFEGISEKILNGAGAVPERWDQSQSQSVAANQTIMSGLMEMKMARTEMMKTKEKVEDIPALKEKVREICYSKSSEESTENGDDIQKDFLKKRIEELEIRKQNQEETMRELKEENERQEERIDAINQYGRREIGQAHNVTVVPGESCKDTVVNFFNYEMGLDITHEDISTCHRMHTPKGSDWNGGSAEYDPACPPIYFKLLSRDVKHYIFRNKANLRGKRNSNGYQYCIHENLTPFRRVLFKEVKEVLRNFRYVWTKEGSILARKHHKSRVFKINTRRDLNNVIDLLSTQ